MTRLEFVRNLDRDASQPLAQRTLYADLRSARLGDVYKGHLHDQSGLNGAGFRSVRFATSASSTTLCHAETDRGGRPQVAKQRGKLRDLVVERSLPRQQWWWVGLLHGVERVDLACSVETVVGAAGALREVLVEPGSRVIDAVWARQPFGGPLKK